MADIKTKPNDESVDAFIDSIDDDKKRRDSRAVVDLMKEVTGLEPKMWGDSIIGFGRYHYKYASGHEGDSCLTGFSPRKQNLTFYITPGFEQYDALLKRLGRFTTGKACLYVKKVEDVDLGTLRELIKQSVDDMAQKTTSGHDTEASTKQ